jgi:alpha-N-acetylglucosamine transferase
MVLIPYLGLHNAHPLLALKISRKKLVRVYNTHGLLKKIVVGNVRIKYQSYIFFSPFEHVSFTYNGSKVIL